MPPSSVVPPPPPHPSSVPQLNSLFSPAALSQVIVVLTREWTVLCFDYKLQLVWENNVQQSVKAEFPTNMFLREMSLLIDAHDINQGDQGIVVIAGSMAHTKENSLYRTRPLKESLRAKRAPPPVDMSKYHRCSFYAFDGKSGSLRWKHETSDFQPELPSLSLLGRAENMKTDATRMIDLGEVDWRVFRRALLAELPHSWQRREDTALTLAHFSKKKPRTAPSTIDVVNHVAVPTAHIPGLTDWARAHQPQESIPMPNVLVAHLREGIEVIHLYTGKRLTQLTLGPGTWDDVNGDGVIDHARVFGTEDHVSRIGDDSRADTPVCVAEVRTGVPTLGELFNATVCRPEHFDIYTPFSSQKHIEAVDPVTYRSLDGKNRKGSGLDTIFMTGNGQISSFSETGEERWVAETIVAWDASHQSESIEELRLFPLHAGLQEQYLLGVAPTAFALVHPETGDVVAEMELPEPLTTPVTIGDLDGDGVNDFLFTTSTSVHAYLTRRRPSSVLFQTLIGLLIMAILAVMISGAMGKAKGKKASQD